MSEWRRLARRERDALLRWARDALNRGRRGAASTYVREAKLCHRAANLGQLRVRDKSAI